MAYDRIVATFIVSGSIISCLATLAVLLHCVATRGKHRSLRHALICNLVLAEFLNSLNNSISGFIYVDTHEMHIGPACTANGFFAHMTAQAVDFNVLAIVLVTLLAVTRMVNLPNLSAQWKKGLICGSIWVVPFITSLASVAVQQMKPVGGNWCWIPLTQLGLRYALADGWRLAIVLLTIALYAFIWVFVYHRYANLFYTRKPRLTCREHTAKEWVRVEPATPESKYNPRSSVPDAPNQPDAVDKQSMKGEQCSEISLPIQADANSSIDGRVESISRWIYVRHPGLITSLSYLKSNPRTPATNRNQTSGPNYHSQCPKVTRSFNLSEDPVPRQLPPADALSPPSAQSTGPRYHSQCPKVTKSFDVSVDSNRQTVESSPVTEADRTVGPHYHSQCPKVTRSFNVAVDPAQATSQPSSATRESPGSGPHYHNQCPKVTKSFDVSIATPSIRSAVASPQGYREQGPHYHNQWPKVTKSFQVSVGSAAEIHTQSSSEMVLQEVRSPGPRYHSQCPKVTRSFVVAVDDPQTPATTPTTPMPPRVSERMQTAGPNYHSQCPKVKRSFGVSFNNEDETPGSPLPPAVPVDTPSSGPNYYSECPKVKRSFSLSLSRPQEESKAFPGPHYHSQCPKVKRSFEVAVEKPQQEPGPHYHSKCPKVKHSFKVSTQDAESATPGPHYHNQCPKVNKSVEVSSIPSGPSYHSQCPKVTKSVDISSVPSGPNYHNQCPKVTRSVSVLPSAPSPIFPDVESLSSGFRGDVCTKTTIITSPQDPPPSPTPGLPPPPWSPTRGARRKTFLFSKSSWSDSTPPTAPKRPSSVEDDRCVEREIRRTLLLNAYPLAYVILWLPQIVNCVMDAKGSASSHPRTMAAMLGMSQYLGLTNAITFAVNEFMRRRMKSKSAKGARPGERRGGNRPFNAFNV